MYRLLTRILTLALAGVLIASTAFAHHGWRWAEGELSELSGIIEDRRLGNPHGEIDVRTDDGEVWVVEVGQPWRNERAGLEPEMLEPGTTVTVRGNRSAREDERLFKTVSVVIEGTSHVLYPGRVD